MSSWAEGRDGLTADVIARSNHLHDPRYMGHQVASVIPETAATGMVTDMLNNGQAIYEMGPTNAVHEDMLMAEIGQLLGFLSDAEASFATEEPWAIWWHMASQSNSPSIWG